MVTAADSVVQGRRQLELFVTLCLWRSHVQSLSVWPERVVISVWPERGAISVWPERGAIRSVSICVARTGCHPFNLYLSGQNGVPSVQSLSEWPERGVTRLVSICVARTGCHPFGLFGQNRVPTVQSLSVGSLLTAE